MNPIVPPVATFLTILTLLTDAGIVLYILSWMMSVFVRPVESFRRRMIGTIRPIARPAAFLVALTATLGSLFYSEIAGYPPCILCWYQRILMYPQTILIGLGIVKNDSDVGDYATAFSVVGGAISLYHYYIQVGGPSIVPCSAVGFSAACSDRFTLEFGYITIPMMALSAFLAIIILMRISRSRRYIHI